MHLGRRRYNWRGPQPSEREEQIANAPDDLFPLTPASQAPAVTTRAHWEAVLPDDTPFIWERDRDVRSEAPCEDPDH